MSDESHRVRISLAITPLVKDRIDRLLISTESESITEVIRKALVVYEELVNIKAGGGNVIIESKNGEREKLRLL